MFFAKNENMKEKMLNQFKFSKEVKEVAKKYGLPDQRLLHNWINIYKKKLETGAVILPVMQKLKKKSDVKPLNNRIKQLEKALEKANVMIYGLNAMIDYAEKKLKVPVRKKPGTKQ
jgi:transposase-like protein